MKTEEKMCFFFNFYSGTTFIVWNGNFPFIFWIFASFLFFFSSNLYLCHLFMKCSPRHCKMWMTFQRLVKKSKKKKNKGIDQWWHMKNYIKKETIKTTNVIEPTDVAIFDGAHTVSNTIVPNEIITENHHHRLRFRFWKFLKIFYLFRFRFRFTFFRAGESFFFFLRFYCHRIHLSSALDLIHYFVYQDNGLKNQK